MSGKQDEKITVNASDVRDGETGETKTVTARVLAVRVQAVKTG